MDAASDMVNLSLLNNSPETSTIRDTATQLFGSAIENCRCFCNHNPVGL
jgi:hypothetical protein